MANTVQDGKGQTLTSALVIKPNTTYLNYIVTGSGQFVSNALSVTGAKILNCTFKNSTTIPIMIASWGAPAAVSDGVEIGDCTFTNFSGSQYYVWLQSCTNLKVHNISFTNGTGTGDCGLIFPQYSSGQFYSLYADNYYGKLVRFWPLLNTKSKIFNCIAINSTQYSGIELQQTAGNTGWDIEIDNCTFGNYTGSIGSAAVTLYIPNPANMSYGFGATKGNVVFNVNLGKLLDNGNATVPPGAPTNANWNTVNKYYTSMQAAGWANDAAVTLPDGTAWDAPIAPPAPLNQPPIAKIGAISAITLPTNSVTLDGTSSTDPDGTISAYAWTFITGPTAPTFATPSASKCVVAGLLAGTYLFGLAVTDNSGATNSTTATVIVNPAIVPTPGPAKTITDVQTVADANGLILSQKTYITNL